MSGIESLDQVGLYVLMCVFGVAWGIMRVIEIYQKVKDSRYKTLINIIETAVQETYDTYTREIKKAREDGKLTAEERKRAFEIALQRAVEIGKKQKIEILRLLPREVVRYYILRALQKLKMQRVANKTR